MADFDLIPSEYRARLRLQRWVRLFAALASTSLITVVVLAGALAYLSGRVEADIERLQQREAIANQHRHLLDQLRQEKVELGEQLKLLEGLRRGAAAEQMFVSIDRALPEGDVWFLRWQFRRAGGRVEQEDRADRTGYFVVVPYGDSGKKPETWRIETHMTVKGQARDHSALSSFVRQLLEQAEIEDVRVLKTSLRRYMTMSVVDFEVAVVVSGKVRSA